VIQPFGSDVKNKSIDEAISQFLKPEVLSGDNAYFCEKCNKKCTAVKGMKFEKLPYILTLQVKRFDFDYETMNRIKLNDEVKIPFILDMNKYIGKGLHRRAASVERRELFGDSSDASDLPPPLVSAPAPTSPIGTYVGNIDDIDETINTGYDDDDLITEKLTHAQLIETYGEYVYELYAVLIHSGSTMGGHYYAYIKSLSTNKWYNFNDSTVTEISEADVKKAWGGESAKPKTMSSYTNPLYPSSYGYTALSSKYTSSANAYMMMYRRISDKNVPEPSSDVIPPLMQEEIRNDEAKAVAEAEAKYRSISEFSLYVSHNDVEKSLSVSKNDTVAAVTKAAWKLFDLHLPESTIKLDDVRLRKYKIECETKILGEPLTFAYKYSSLSDRNITKSYYGDDNKFVLEERCNDGTFPEYNRNDISVLVREYDEATKTVKKPVVVAVKESITCLNFKIQLCNRFKLTLDTLRLMKCGTGYYSKNQLHDIESTVDYSRLNPKDAQVFFVESAQLDVRGHWESVSKCQAVIEEEENIITVKFSKVNESEATEFIVFDKRCKVLELKGKIAAHLKLENDPSDIILKRYTHVLRDFESLGSAITFYGSDTTLCVELNGVEKEYLFAIHLEKSIAFKVATNSEETITHIVTRPDFEDTFRIEPLAPFFVTAKRSTLLSDLRVAVKEKLQEMNHEEAEVSPECIRIERARTYPSYSHPIFRETRIDDDNNCLMWNQDKPLDLKCTIMPEPEHLGYDDIVIQVIWFSRKNYLYEKRLSMIVDKTSTESFFDSFVSQLNNMRKTTHDLRNLLYLQVHSYTSMSDVSLLKLSSSSGWDQINQLRRDNIHYQKDIKNLKDGSHFIICDQTEDLKELSDEEVKARTESEEPKKYLTNYSSFPSVSSSDIYKPKPRKEAGIKIHVSSHHTNSSPSGTPAPTPPLEGVPTPPLEGSAPTPPLLLEAKSSSDARKEEEEKTRGILDMLRI
jgi:hypothetical protein